MSFYFYDTPNKKNFHTFLNNSILNSPNYGNGYDRKYNDSYRYGNYGNYGYFEKNTNQKNPLTSSPSSLFKYSFPHSNETNKLNKSMPLTNNECNNKNKNIYHFSSHPLLPYYNPLPYQNNFSNNYSYPSLLHYGNGNGNGNSNNDFSNSISNLLNLKNINSMNTNNKNNNNNNNNNQTFTFSYPLITSPMSTLQKSSYQKITPNKNKFSNHKSFTSKSSTIASPKTSTSEPSSPKSSSFSPQTNTSMFSSPKTIILTPSSQDSLTSNLTSESTPNLENLNSKFSQNSCLNSNITTNSTSESNHPEPLVLSKPFSLPNKRSPSEQMIPNEIVNSSPKLFLKQFSTPNMIKPTTSQNTFSTQNSLPKSYSNVSSFNFNNKDHYHHYNDISFFNKSNDNNNDDVNNTENVPISPISANTETQENTIMEKPYSSSSSSYPPISHFNTNSMIGFRPKSDLYEDDKAFYIHLDLPGITRDQIHLELLEIHGDSTLYISGEKHFYQNPYSSTLSSSSVTSTSSSPSSTPSPSVPSNSSKFYPNGENLKISKLGCEFGKFFRSFSIPESTDLEKIEAKMENGSLDVILPKKEPQKHERRMIEVK